MTDPAITVIVGPELQRTLMHLFLDRGGSLAGAFTSGAARLDRVLVGAVVLGLLCLGSLASYMESHAPPDSRSVQGPVRSVEPAPLMVRLPNR